MMYLGFPVLSLIYMILFLIMYFSKKRIDLFENTLIIGLMKINIVGLILEIGCYVVLAFTHTQDTFLGNFVLRSYIYYLIIFDWILTGYIFVITDSEKHKKNIKKYCNKVLAVFLPLVIVGLITTYFTKIYCFSEYPKYYTYGTGTDYLIIMTMIVSPVWFYRCLRVLLKKKSKDYMIRVSAVLFGIILVGIAGSLMQLVDRSMLIITSAHSIMLALIYFTIENPDIKMLEEYNENKELTENNIEARSNLLFKISEEVKTPLRKIKYYSDDILETESVEKKNANATNISTLSSNLLRDVNETLNVSYLDKKNIKVFDASYDIYNFYSQLVYIIKGKLRSNIIFKYSISDAIPDRLYGDSSKLKQIISSLLLNNITRDENATIDLDIYAIIKYDVCRLIFTIQNSACKLTLPEINDILDSDVEITEEQLKQVENLDIDLKLIKKFVNILDGTLLIESNESGTIFKVIINQLVCNNSNIREIEKVSSQLSNKEKVLLIDDDYKELTHIANELKKNNYDVTSLMCGSDAVGELSNKHYDILIVDDEMANDSAVEIIKKVDELEIDDLIKIVMLDSSKEFIKNHYIEDYSFNDYLLKDNYVDEIERIKDKF